MELSIMNFKKGKDRNSPLEIGSLESVIERNNPIRLIDGFVDSLDLKKLGFQVEHKKEGRPPYHPSTLLKLYIYGYMRGIRSSRKLEASTRINLELMWLLNNLSPDHSTISTFRKEYGSAIKAVFRESVSVAMHFNLIGKKLLAGDSTKLRAQNSNKNNHGKKKVTQRLKSIEEKLSRYLEEAALEGEDKSTVREKIEEQKKKRKNIQN